MTNLPLILIPFPLSSLLSPVPSIHYSPPLPLPPYPLTTSLPPYPCHYPCPLSPYPLPLLLPPYTPSPLYPLSLHSPPPVYLLSLPSTQYPHSKCRLNQLRVGFASAHVWYLWYFLPLLLPLLRPFIAFSFDSHSSFRSICLSLHSFVFIAMRKCMSLCVRVCACAWQSVRVCVCLCLYILISLNEGGHSVARNSARWWPTLTDASREWHSYQQRQRRRVGYGNTGSDVIAKRTVWLRCFADDECGNDVAALITIQFFCVRYSVWQ